MNFPKAVIFDWDDTLANTKEAVISSLDFVAYKYNNCSYHEMRSHRNAKLSLKENFVNYFGTLYQKAYQDYL